MKDSRAENSTAVLDRHYHHCDVESRVGHDFGKSATHLRDGFIEGQRQKVKWTEIYMLPRCSCHCLECDNDSLFFAICRPVFRSACFHGQASTPKTNALLITRGKVCAMQSQTKTEIPTRPYQREISHVLARRSGSWGSTTLVSLSPPCTSMTSRPPRDRSKRSGRTALV